MKKTDMNRMQKRNNTQSNWQTLLVKARTFIAADYIFTCFEKASIANPIAYEKQLFAYQKRIKADRRAEETNIFCNRFGEFLEKNGLSEKELGKFHAELTLTVTDELACVDVVTGIFDFSVLIKNKGRYSFYTKEKVAEMSCPGEASAPGLSA